MGKLYENGSFGVEKNVNKAKGLYEKCVEGEKNPEIAKSQLETDLERLENQMEEEMPNLN